MKRILPLTLALLLPLFAHAATLFPDGEALHQDPFCPARALTLESYFADTVECAAEDAAALTLCSQCKTALTDVAPRTERWYFHPDGGHNLHTDPDCPAVNKQYRPMQHWATAKDPTWVPHNACPVCRPPQAMINAADVGAWSVTAAVKAQYLPGVWTVPSDAAIDEEAAWAAAHAHMEQLQPGEIFSICVMHYDHGLATGDGRATYKAIVTTPLRHPVCVLYLDALTGEIYHTQPVTD